MWQKLNQLHWTEPLPLFFVGISLWIGAALSLDLIRNKEFHIWKGFLGLTVFLVLVSHTLIGSLIFFGIAGILGWILLLRFSHCFQSWWIIILGYELVRLQPFSFPDYTLLIGLVLWFYGGFKAVSERQIRHVWVGWIISQLGIICIALVGGLIMKKVLQYEIIGFGVFGTLLASLLNQARERAQSSFLSEWQGRHSIKSELIFGVSILGLGFLSGWCGIIFWQAQGYLAGLSFMIGWVALVLSYIRVGKYLFLNRSLQLVSMNKL